MWIIYILLILLIMIFSNATIEAARNSVELFAYSVVPSLFPFFVLTNMLIKKGNLALIAGFLCGYPAGAIACSSLYKEGKLSKSKAETYTSFINNAGPTFVLGTIGISLCHSMYAGVLLLLTHIAAALTTILIFFLIKRDKTVTTLHKNIPACVPPEKIYFGEQLTAAIISALKQIAAVGGYIIFFSVLISILNEIGLKNIFLFSFLEITTGLKYIVESLPEDAFIPALINILPVIALFLGWSGLSIHAQIIAILSKAGLSSRYFIIGKISQAAFAFIYMFILIKIPFVQNLIYEIPVFSADADILKKNTGISPIFLIIESIPVIIILLGAIKKKLISLSL